MLDAVDEQGGDNVVSGVRQVEECGSGSCQSADAHGGGIREVGRFEAEGSQIDGGVAGVGIGAGEDLGASAGFDEGHAAVAIADIRGIAVGDSGAGVEGEGRETGVAARGGGEDTGEVLVTG